MSDPHFGHKNQTKFRTEFKTSNECSQYIVDNCKRVLTKRDKLYVLGDIAFSQDEFEYFKKIASIPENVTVILGNHDLENSKCAPIQQFIDIGCEVSSMIKYRSAWLTHCPMHPNELRGRFNIHGHVHYKDIDDLRYLNLCVERTNYTPVKMTDLLNEINARKEFARLTFMRQSVAEITYILDKAYDVDVSWSGHIEDVYQNCITQMKNHVKCDPLMWDVGWDY